MSKTWRARSTFLIIGLALFLLPGRSAVAEELPDPSQLPVATMEQVPLTTAYNALNVPGLAAGGNYLDPTTGVKIYKLTSSAFPTPSNTCDPPESTVIPKWAHDYSEGGDEVSLPYNGNTRAVLVRQVDQCASYNNERWWLIDFTPGVGVSNPRQLTGNFQPWDDLAFTFSNNPATPYYAYVATLDDLNGDGMADAGTIRRIDIRGTGPGTAPIEAPGNGWPKTDTGAANCVPGDPKNPRYECPVWLHQSEFDGLFTWMRGATGSTVVGYEPATGTLKTYTERRPITEALLNEPRIDRAGRYVGIDMNTPTNGLVVWDWQTGGENCDFQTPNCVLWSTTGDPGIPFGHNASLRRRWVVVDGSMNYPPDFAKFIPDVPDSGQHIGGPANSSLYYGNGNWIQHPDNLDDQWALFSHYGSLVPSGSGWLAPGGMIFITTNGQRRLLGHPYNTVSEYTYFSFAKSSSDGKYVLFTSDMNGSGRSDVFLAEVPLIRREAVVWTNIVNATATGSIIQKTGGSDGLEDAGATSQQQILSGNGFFDFVPGFENTTRGVGLSNGNSDTSLADVDFAILLKNNGIAEVWENGTYKATIGSYGWDDLFAIRVEDGVVRYHRNGALIYTSTMAPRYPLLVDTTLVSADSTIAASIETVPPDSYDFGQAAGVGVGSVGGSP